MPRNNKSEEGAAAAEEAPEQRNERQECGIVMPISRTASHDAEHWVRVQTLLHRAVVNAGLEPKNVWLGSPADRITVRILGNLFGVPIALCDISDLNPNVMLELGMRLTSKKPTVVVAERGSTIPFDIQDFEAIFYPADLNIIDMEKFFDELEAHLKAKLEAYNAGTYEPFLKDIGPIEFLEPEGRAIPFEQLVENRLGLIMDRLETMDRRVRAAPVGRPISANFATSAAAALVADAAAKASSGQAGKPVGYVNVAIDGDVLTGDKAVVLLNEHPSVFSAIRTSTGVLASLVFMPTKNVINDLERYLLGHGISATITTLSPGR